jgi:hypothetical protein
MSSKPDKTSRKRAEDSDGVPDHREAEAKELPPGNLKVFRWGWTAFMVLATSVPHFVWWLSTPPGFRYTWIVPPYAQDSFSYMAWAQQAAHGSLLLQAKYTALPHSPFLFNPFFLICGWISALFAADVGIVLWLAKAVGVGLFFVTLFSYTDYLRLNRVQSIFATVLVGVSSGFGGLLAFAGMAEKFEKMSIIPTDGWLVDSNTYWSLLSNPLFPYSLTLMLLTVYLLDRGSRDGRKGDLWLSGLSAGVLALIHPYSQPLLLALAIVITIARRKARAVGFLLRYCGALFPFAVYLILVAELHPLVSKHNLQGAMKSPPLVAYVLGFGFPLVLALGGLTVRWGAWIKRYWHILLWFLLSVGFCYLPFWFQRKFIFGAHVPLCILAAVSCEQVLRFRVRPWARKWVLAVAAVLLVPLLVSSQVLVLMVQREDVKRNVERSYYVSEDLMAGLEFLKHNTKPEEVVYANVTTSRLIPAFSGNTVIWGHWAMSVDFEQRRAWNSDLFHPHADWDDEQRGRKFWGNDIHYIFADGSVRQTMERNPWAWRVILAEADPVFTNSSVLIYRHRNKEVTP